MLSRPVLARGTHPLLVGSCPDRVRAAAAQWIRDAVAAGERVLVRSVPDGVRRPDGVRGPTGVPGPGEADPDALARAGVDPKAIRSGQVRTLDARRLRAATGGRATGLREVYSGLVEQACRAGWAGLAVTGDPAALSASVRDEHELWAHERDVDRLTRELPLRVLCCYGAGEPRDLLAGMAAVHHRCTTDVLWNATTHQGCLRLAGEIDISNADRFAAVLHAARREGTRCVEVSGLRFCGAAGLAVLVEAANGSAPGRPLVLRNPIPGLARILRLVGLDGGGARIESDGDGDPRVVRIR
ncbi:STAS domain-containing protein [Pseudonocardia saturnea]